MTNSDWKSQLKDYLNPIWTLFQTNFRPKSIQSPKLTAKSKDRQKINKDKGMNNNTGQNKK